MKIAFAVSGFPKTTQTFIQNQTVGLLSKNIDLTIYAESNPNAEVTHSATDQYDLDRRVVYTGDPQSYWDGVRLLASSLPSLLRRDDVPLQAIASILTSGTSAPRELNNLDIITRSGPADIYHTHFGPVGNKYLDLTECYDVPFIVSFYGWDASRLLKKNPNTYDELFDRVDAVTVLSNDMRATLVEYGCQTSKIHIQPLCIDTDLFPYQERSSDDEQIKLLTVARFVEKKGIVYALEAVARLSDKYDIQYTIIGDGERRELIEETIKKYELEDVVDLRGWQSQSVVADEMANAHLFLLPSVTAKSGDKEGTPTVLLEAQSMGLPVVSTYHAGIPEIVEDGETGLLVPERDSDALADALEKLLSEPEQWAKMGENGREHIEQNHSIEAVTDGLLDLYRSLR